MKYLIYGVLISLICSANPLTAQLYNDGAEVTIQANAFMHLQGDFTNQGGTIFNDGLIELGGNWINTVVTNPLNPGSGDVDLVGTDQTIGGDFNTLFNFLALRDAQNVRLEATAGIENEFNLNNGTLNLNRNTLHLLSPMSTALPNNGGGIIAETSDVYGYVRWDIGGMGMGMGDYLIPFISNSSTAIPTSFTLTEAGIDDDGFMLFSTYGTSEANTPFPISVNNIDLPGNESGQQMVDRFWIVSAEEYVTPPTTNLSLSFDDGSEIGGANEIDLADGDLEILNWDGVDTWNAISSDPSIAPTVSSEGLNDYGTFVIWSPFTTSVIDQSKLVSTSLFPNPSTDAVNLQFSSEFNDDIELYIVDQLGRIVGGSSATITQGENKLSISVANLSSGSYQLVMVGENINAVESFVKF